MAENREWVAAVLEGSAEIAADTVDLGSGGMMILEGSPEALQAWASSAASAAGRRLFDLDLGGWEPETTELEDFAHYQSAIDDAEGSASPAPGGLFQAATVSLFPEALAEPGDSAPMDRTRFVTELIARSAEPSVVLLADGDTVPDSLRRALLAAAEKAEGRLAVVDGTRGLRPSAARVEAKLEAGPDPRLEEIQGHARRVLEALAILETPFPLEPLLALLVADISVHEDVIDEVDDLLADELEIVEDLGFVHPILENSLYRLSDPLFAARLLAGIDVRPRAEALLGHLRLRLPSRARFTTSILARLAEQSGREEQARRLRQRLRWWVPAGELGDDLRWAFEAGEIQDQGLLTLAADGVLAPDLRLEILRTHGELGIPPESEGLSWLYQARALRDSGKALEALEAIERSLEWHALNRGRENEAFLDTQLAAARLLADVGEAKAARDQLIQARELAGEIFEPEDPRHAVLAAELGRVLMAVGELRAAKAPLEETVERALARFGENHPQSVTARNNLAALLIDIGELEEARDHLVAAIDGAKKAGLPIPLRVGLWSNLQTVASRLGNDPGTESLLEQFSAQLEGESPEIGQFLQLAGAAGEAGSEGVELQMGHDFGGQFDEEEVRVLAEMFNQLAASGRQK